MVRDNVKFNQVNLNAYQMGLLYTFYYGLKADASFAVVWTYLNVHRVFEARAGESNF